MANYLAKQQCICGTTDFKVLREATALDEEGWEL
jgi:hypothetical protein